MALLNLELLPNGIKVTMKYLNDENMSTIKHEEIVETARQFKETNGNSNVSNKDMLIYLMHKVDDLSQTYSNKGTLCEKRFATKSMLISMFTFLLGLLGGLAVLVFKHLSLW